MLDATIKLIKFGLQSDPTATLADRNRVMAAVRGDPIPRTQPDTASRLVRRAEVARQMSRSLRFVDLLAASGVLKKRKLPGRVRASGFLASDVAALIEGGVVNQ
jgi:hypothetical protein